MVRNIIFDLGNVILPLNVWTARIKFALHGVYSMNKNLTNILCSFERGEITSKMFLEKVKKELLWGSKKDVLEMWESLIGNLEQERIDYLLELKKKYNLFLLSNINEIHENRIKVMLGEEQYSRFTSSFTKVYYSHKIGYRKPDLEAWQIILQENKLEPKETLFVDDLAINTKAASGLGLQVWNIKDHTFFYTIADKLKNA